MTGTQYLEGLEARLRGQIERVKSVADGLSDEQMAQESEKGVWGIGQILAHLNVATEGYIPSMGAAISRGEADSGVEPKHTFVAGFLLGGMHRPGIPVPGSMVPTGQRSKKDLQIWLDNCDRVLQLFEQAKGKDLVANKFKNPFLPIGKFNLADGFEIIVEHNERHVRQMEERIEKIRALV
jgi:hypothetical protein